LWERWTQIRRFPGLKHIRNRGNFEGVMFVT
jgi:hypothetical protein